MSISGVLGRFLAVYIVLMICASLILQFFAITSKSSINVSILIVAVMWPCIAFGKKNKRYFTVQEKSKIVRGMIGINLLIQALIGGIALAAGGKLSVGTFVFALAIVGIIQSLAIALFVGIVGKNFFKQPKEQVSTGDE